MEKVRSSLLEWGVASRAHPGEGQSGDRHVVEVCPDGVLVAAIDGLGHGAAAADAAEIAVATLKSNLGESVLSQVLRCHEALRGSRGVVMSLAKFDERDSTITAIGVGNVEGLLVRAGVHSFSGSETLMLRGGVVGEQLPPLRAEVIPIACGDTLVMVTDGIHSDFAEALDLNPTPQQIADSILASQKKETDDALVLVARFCGNTR